MSNPYEPPGQGNPSGGAQTVVQRPAVALIVVALISIVCGLLALAMDVVLVATGAIERLEEVNEGPVSEYTIITIRSIWGVVLLIASTFVLFGAMKMRNLQNYRTARAAAVVAMIPFLGPCCVLGIPFGIWALVALGKPGVRSAFR
jgi:uncharacterized membrane protein